MNEPMFEINVQETKQNYAVIAVSPLEQGYGDTLGNSLRRVLLTSLPGMAVTKVRMNGVKHQFTTLKGMKEDVVEFLLNLKRVRFSGEQIETGQVIKASISVKGPGEVRAKDIKLPSNVKAANPEMLLAVLNKGASLEADLEIESGVGYIPAKDRDSGALGEISLDASFSPIVRVNYKVEETRVGRLTNYDKLLLQIWTDGTVDAKDALVTAGKILVSYFSQVVTPKRVVKQENGVGLDDLGPVGKLSVEEIGLPTRVSNALVKADYETVEDLVNADREKLVKVRNLGEKSLKIIAVALAEKGVKFAI